MKLTITLSRLKELFDYNPSTGLFARRVTRGNQKKGRIAGTLHPKGYRIILIDGGFYKAHRLAWFVMYGEWPKKQIDHINSDRNDNRISNLREATNSENQMNQILKSNNKSGFKGVCWNKRLKRWVSQININGRVTHLGLFVDLNEAATTVRNAREKHHGEFTNHG